MTTKARLVFDVIGPPTIARFNARCRHPMAEQEKLLRTLLRENADTAFGRRHGFASIETFSRFQKQVPISEYDDIAPYVDASRHGQPAQLTAARPVFYAMTSGTTGPAKYIPVTEASRHSKARLMRLWVAGMLRDHPTIADGAVLQPASPEVEAYAPDGTPCGAEAGHAYRNMPKVMRGMYPVPYSVCEIPDYDARYYALLRVALLHAVKVIATPNPSTILLIARALGARTEQLVRDVRDGTLDATMEIPAEIRREIERLLRPDARRAAFLERAAAAGGGRLLPRHVWPDMAVLACWKGGTVRTYLDQLGPYFPEGLPIRDLGWLASECRGSVPLSDDGDSGPLAIATNVYEFFPADAERKPAPTDLLTVDQLEAGRRYLIYVTTAGGLCRYAMHDIMEVTGTYQQTPEIAFVQKEKGIVSFTGEKLTETQVLAAVDETLDQRRQDRNFIAAVGQPPTANHDPYYLFLVEYDTPPSDETGARAAQDLDGALCRHNIEYASKRKSGRLAPPVLRVLEPGQFDAYQREALQAGARDGQFKILRLTADRSFADHFSRRVRDYQAA
jgi:GH3 auxin-responsive promoter